MFELSREIPDVEVLLALQPEELGAKLVFLAAERNKGQRNERAAFNPGHMTRELWQDSFGPTPYPPDRKFDVRLAILEAWAWLEAQGLIVPDPSSGDAGFKQLSRRARAFASEPDLRNFASARRLPKEILHSKISNVVWQEFIRGQYDVAAFQAMKAVEVAVREASSLQGIGVRLIRAAFSPNGGPLADDSTDEGEQVARMELFAGAIGSYKNPHSHRDVDLDDPVEAIEIILLANHLLRIVDARRAAMANRNPAQ